MARARKDADLSALASYAEQANAAGDPQGFLWEFEAILAGAIEFDSEVPEFEREKIIAKAAHSKKKDRPLTSDSLIGHCSRAEQAYLSLPKRSYRLLTEISLWFTIEPRATRVDEATITFKPRTILGFSERSNLFSASRANLGFDLPKNYMRASILVPARTPFEAAEKGLNAIDLLRGLWNLALNRSKIWRLSGGRTQPVNEIRLSPFHTIHESDGTLATRTYWYEPGYNMPASPYSDEHTFHSLQKVAASLQSSLRKLPYKVELTGAVVRYVRALDSADLNDTFLRLWSLLEYLTDSTREPYKVTTRRAAFLFADRERSQLALAYLTSARNRFVHAGSSDGSVEPRVFLLKRFVDALLMFHIHNPFGFTDRGDAAAFMDLPRIRWRLLGVFGAYGAPSGLCLEPNEIG